MHCMLDRSSLVVYSVHRGLPTVYGSAVALSGGMAWGGSLSLYINWFRSKFQDTLKTDEKCANSIDR